MAVSDALGERRAVEVPGAGTIEYRVRGSGPPVVFAHGVGVNGDLWRRVVPDVASAGYRCFAPDLPLGGHRVPLSGSPDMSLFGLAALLAGFIEALDVGEVTLVANDTGGAVSQALVASGPPLSARIGRLVLTSCDAFDRYPPPAVAYLKTVARIPGGLWLLGRAVQTRFVQRLPIAYGWATSAPVEPSIMESYVGGVRSHAGVRRDMGRVLRAARKEDMQRASRSVGAFDRPALVAWSADDRFFPVEHGRELARLMPDARFRLIEDSRTFSPEDQPQRLVELLLDFLGTTAVPGRQAPPAGAPRG